MIQKVYRTEVVFSAAVSESTMQAVLDHGTELFSDRARVVNLSQQNWSSGRQKGWTISLEWHEEGVLVEASRRLQEYLNEVAADIPYYRLLSRCAAEIDWGED